MAATIGFAPSASQPTAPATGIELWTPDSVNLNWVDANNTNHVAGPIFPGVYYANLYGISPSNSAAANSAALTALVGPSGTATAGSTIYFPGGTYSYNANTTVGAAYTFQGQGSAYTGGYTIFSFGTATTGFLTITAGKWYTRFFDITFAAATAQTSGACVAAGNSVGINFYRCSFVAISATQTWFNAIDYTGANSANSTIIADCQLSGFTNFGVNVNAAGASLIIDKTIIQGVYGSSTQTAAAGVNVVSAGALQITTCDILGSNNNLLIAPTTGLVVASIHVANTYFDNANGSCLKITGAGATVRTKFLQCTFTTSATTTGLTAVEISTTVAAGAQGIDFDDCNILNTFGTTGTTNGFLITGAADFRIANCRIAGWTTGAQITPIAAATTEATIANSTFSNTGGYGVNTTDIVLNAGSAAYGAILITNNRLGGTTPLTNNATAPTAANAGKFRILDNAGYNPHGAVTTPTIASATLFTNTTMLRVTVYFKSGATPPTVYTVNGVTTVLPLASQIVTTVLDPGGTITFTYTVAPTWTWVGN